MIKLNEDQIKKLMTFLQDDKKIAGVKFVREITKAGLKEAKMFVDSVITDMQSTDTELDDIVDFDSLVKYLEKEYKIDKDDDDLLDMLDFIWDLGQEHGHEAGFDKGYKKGMIDQQNQRR